MVDRVIAQGPFQALACIVLLAACGSSVGNVRRDIAKRDWHEVRSEHFALTTDLSVAETTKRIAELEQLWSAIADTLSLIVPNQALPSKTISMIHLAACEDFRAIVWSESIGGYVTTSLDFEKRRTVVTCEATPVRTEILLHEFMHTFNYHLFAMAPAWLNEGLATYYQTIAVKDGKVMLGTLPQIDKKLWHHPKWLPSLKGLLAFDYEGFNDAPDRRHYFAAWKLVHLLNNSSPEYHARFQSYLARLAAGVSKERAWSDSFGDIPFDRLSRQYQRYQEQKKLQIFQAPYAMRAKSTSFTSRQLRPGERHAIWVQLLMTKARATKHNAAILRDIRTQLAWADADDPTWDGIEFWRAAFAHAFQDSLPDPEDPIALLQQYLNKEPEDVRAQLGLVTARMDAIVPPEHTGLAEVPAGLEAVEDDVRRLVVLGESPEELHRIAWYWALRAQPMVGLNFVRRALEADTGCGGCFDTLALMLFQLGRMDEAAMTQRRAINMLSESGVSASMTTRLAHYEEALKQAKASGELPSTDRDGEEK